MSYVKSIAKKSTLLFALTILSAFVAYVWRVVLARSLTPNEFGLFYAVFAFVSLFMFLRDLGMNTALPKFISENLVKGDKQKIADVISSVFIWQTISSFFLIAGIYLTSSYVGVEFFKDQASIPMLHIFLLYLIFSMLSLFISSVFLGFQKTFLFSLTDPLTNIFSLLFSLLFIYLGYGVLSAAWATTLAWVVISMILYPFFRKIMNEYNGLSLTYDRFKATSKELFSFSFPVLLSNIGTRILSRVDTLVLVLYVTMDQVGVFNVILPVSMLFSFFTDSMGAVIFPMISELWAKKDMGRLSEGLHMFFKYFLLLLFPCFLLFSALSGWILTLFFGASYSSGISALRVLVFAMLFYSAYGINTRFLSAIGNTKKVTFVVLVSAAVNIALNFLFIPSLGLMGASIALTIGYLVGYIMSSVYVVRDFGLKGVLKTSLIVLLICGASLLACYGSLWLGYLVYVLCLFMFKAIDMEDAKRYWRVFVK